MTGYRAFVQVFCPECAWAIKLNEANSGYCHNFHCNQHGIPVQVLVRVVCPDVTTRSFYFTSDVVEAIH